MTELPDGYLAVKSYLDSRMTRDDFWKRASDGLEKMLKELKSFREADDMCMCGHIRDQHGPYFCHGDEACNCMKFIDAVGIPK